VKKTGWKWYIEGEKSHKSSERGFPKGFIKGSVKAGDAFYNGILFRIYKCFDLKYSLGIT
jgi:hypothetical protein